MPINDVQDRVEKSVFEAIRLKLVAEGYLPDIASGAFPNTPQGDVAYEAAMSAIAQAQGFAAEVYGHSSALAKGNKRTPRISIITRRIMPGDIGMNIRGGFSPDPLDPDTTQKLKPSLQSANLHLDINVVPGRAIEDRALHAILAEALSTWSYIPLYDDPTESFFIRQFNFYDLPDNRNGIEEKVYSYEVPDLYLYEGIVTRAIPPISQITVNTSVIELTSVFNRTGSLVGPFQGKEGIFMDLSGISYKLP